MSEIRRIPLVILLLLVLSPLSAINIDDSINEARYLMESRGNYDQALILLNNLQYQTQNPDDLARIQYYLMQCYLKSGLKSQAEEIYKKHLSQKTAWSSRIVSEYQTRNQIQNSDKELFGPLDSVTLQRMTALGGSLQDFLKLKDYGITPADYLELLQSGFTADTFIHELDATKLSADELFILIRKKISTSDYQYLVITHSFLTKNRFFGYTETTTDIYYLSELYKLGQNENKFLSLKENKIDPEYYLKALKSGFKEREFYRFKDSKISQKDFGYFQQLRKMGYSPGDFYLARIFGESNYTNFRSYIINRNWMTAHAIILSSLLSSGAGLLIAGTISSSQETEYRIKVLLLTVEYLESTDYQRKLDIYTIEKPEAQRMAILYSQLKYGFLVSGISTMVLAVIPSIFIGYLTYKNYRMLNIFSALIIDTSADRLAVSISLKL